MHHEFDSSLDTMLVALAHLFKDSKENFIDAVFADRNDSLNNLMLGSRFV